MYKLIRTRRPVEINAIDDVLDYMRWLPAFDNAYNELREYFVGRRHFDRVHIQKVSRQYECVGVVSSGDPS